MKKIILFFLIFLIPQTAFSDDVENDVFKQFSFEGNERVSVYIYRLDGKIHAEIKAQGFFYSFLLFNLGIRQDGQIYTAIGGFGFYDAEGEPVAAVLNGDTEYLTIKKKEWGDDLDLSKEFDLVSDFDLDYVTVPAKKSSGGGGGGGCFISLCN